MDRRDRFLDRRIHGSCEKFISLFESFKIKIRLLVGEPQS
jgi:hypothetical protein